MPIHVFVILIPGRRTESSGAAARTVVNSQNVELIIEFNCFFVPGVGTFLAVGVFERESIWGNERGRHTEVEAI